MTARSAVIAGVLVACGGDHHHGIDAPPLDAPTDTLVPSSGQPPPEAVAIHVTQRGEPAPNVAVYFQTPDSTVELATTTDPTGIAWALAADGDFVTVIEPANTTGATAVTTFAGVRRSDRLELALDPVVSNPQVTVTLHVPLQNGALAYQIHNPCGDVVALDASGSGDVTFLDCGAGLIDLVITPTDSDGASVFGALFTTGVVVASGSSVTIVGGYTSFDTASFTYTVPATVGYVNTYQAILTPRGRVFDASAGAAPASGSAATSVKQPHTPGGTTALTVTDAVPIDSETSQQSVFEWSPWSATHALDVAAQRLPEYAGVATFDLASSSVTWSERAGGVAPSLVRAGLNVYRDAIPEGRRWTWRIAAPRGGTAVALPHIPVNGFDFNPTAGDSVTVDDLTNALVPGGYDAVRAHAFDDLVRVISVGTGTMIVEGTYSPPL